MSYEELISIKNQLRDDIFKYEFNCFDPSEDKTIESKCFMKSIIVYVNLNRIDRYLRHIKDINKAFDQENGSKRISEKEFIAFHIFLSNLENLESRINQFRYIDYDMLDELV